jgi:hypothetical protein
MPDRLWLKYDAASVLFGSKCTFCVKNTGYNLNV